MATLATRNFATLVGNFAAAVQSASATLIDFTIGSILRACAEATAGVTLWLQGLILQLLKTTRASTSLGPDLDTWVADFGIARIGASPATGLLTMSRASVSNPAFVPVGSQAATLDNTEVFTVYADATLPYYQASPPGYNLAAGVTSFTVPAAAVNPGSEGNVVAGAISVLKTGISGIDNVTNVSAFTNGSDFESDAALRLRFVAFINALAKATVAAITYAVTSIQEGMQVSVLENQQYNGTAQPGFVTVIVDDGSGAIPAPLLAQCNSSVIAVRSAGVQTAVYAAVPMLATVVMVLGYAPGYYPPSVIAAVAAALSNHINGLGLTNPLRFTRLEQVAYDASPGVQNVISVTLNGGTHDLMPSAVQTVKVGALIVS